MQLKPIFEKREKPRFRIHCEGVAILDTRRADVAAWARAQGYEVRDINTPVTISPTAV